MTEPERQIIDALNRLSGEVAELTSTMQALVPLLINLGDIRLSPPNDDSTTE